MIRSFKLTTILATAALASAAAITAHAATTTGTARANVVGSLSVTEGTELSFGTFSPGDSEGSVTSSGQTAGGVRHFGGTTTDGSFTITGGPGAQVSVDVPTNVTLEKGGDSMIAALESTAGGATLDGTGNLTFTVSGMLTVDQAQPEGEYVGEYIVTVNYAQ